MNRGDQLVLPQMETPIRLWTHGKNKKQKCPDKVIKLRSSADAKNIGTDSFSMADIRASI